MRSCLAVLTWAALATVVVAAADQAGAQPTVKLTQAAAAAEVKTDQRDVMTPEVGLHFVWVSAALSGPQKPIDLTKVALTKGGASYPLVGVDTVWGGDPNQFSMIAPIKLKTGKTRDPLEETRSTGDVAFAFTPGKVATMNVLKPPQSVCLLFLVPQAVSAGQVKGLTAAALPIPAIPVGKQ